MGNASLVPDGSYPGTRRLRKGKKEKKVQEDLGFDYRPDGIITILTLTDVAKNWLLPVDPLSALINYIGALMAPNSDGEQRLSNLSKVTQET